jgi:hypothetical protein
MEALLSVALVQHVGSFLPEDEGRAALGYCSRRLHHAALQINGSNAVDRWRFLLCFGVGDGAARPLRWRCWLPDAGEERRFLHAALRR